MINIVDVKQASITQLYSLIQEVYSSTDSMADSFDRAFESLDYFNSVISCIESNPGSFLIVAQENSKPIGYFWLKARSEIKLKHTAEFSMGISLDHQGKGIGGKLLDEAFKRLTQERKIEILYLMVREDNEAAVRLYKKSNFEVVARLQKDTKIGETYYTGLMMRKFLN